MVCSARNIDPAVQRALEGIRPALGLCGLETSPGATIRVLALLALADPAHTAAAWQRCERYALAEWGHPFYAHRALLDAVARQTRAA